MDLEISHGDNLLDVRFFTGTTLLFSFMNLRRDIDADCHLTPDMAKDLLKMIKQAVEDYGISFTRGFTIKPQGSFPGKGQDGDLPWFFITSRQKSFLGVVYRKELSLGLFFGASIRELGVVMNDRKARELIAKIERFIEKTS